MTTSNFLPENLNSIFVNLNQQQLDNLLIATKKTQDYLATFANQSETNLWQDLELAFGGNFDQEKTITAL